MKWSFLYNFNLHDNVVNIQTVLENRSNNQEAQPIENISDRVTLE